MPRVLLATVLLLGATAAATPANAAERRFPDRGFTAIGVGGSDHVRVAVGGGYSIRAVGDPADLAELRVERRGDGLDLGRIKGAHAAAHAVTFYVTMPRIDAASVGGSGSIDVDRVQGKQFAASIGGSGSIAVAALTAGQTDISIGGSGSVSARGAVEHLSVSIGGSGRVAAGGLTAHDAAISVAGSGSVLAAVDGNAAVHSSGSGDIDLGPRARCTIHKTGSGSVRCGG